MTYQELMDWISKLSNEDKNKPVYVYSVRDDKTMPVIDWDITINNDHVGSMYPVLEIN